MLDSPVRPVLRRLDPDTEQFRAIAEESRLEGYWMLLRLQDSWTSGRNRFAGRSELLVGAWRGGELVGVCGLSADPHVEGRREGRVRHLYVSVAHRGCGVGRALVWAIIDKASKHFPVLNLRAPEEAFAFYEALGFSRLEGEPFATHRMRFTRPPRRRSG